MTIIRSLLRHHYILLDTKIIQESRLSLEGKGVYGCLEAGVLSLEEVPENIIKELIEVGYLEEVTK